VKNNVYINRSSFISALGRSSEESFWEKLYSGQSAVSELRHFPTERLSSHSAVCIHDLWDGNYENRVLELVKRTLSDFDGVPEDTFIIWTGVKENVENIEKKVEGPASSNPCNCRKWISEFLEIRDCGMEINAACASSTIGIAYGAYLISSGQRRNVLVCAADIVSRFVFTGFAALRALSPTVCRPFDKNRDGLVLGDGAAAVLLTADSGPVRIAGWGISNDANHITGPSRDGSGLADAISQAMNMEKTSASSVGAFCAHGTGTVYNDAMELLAYKKIFGERKMPLFSIKGAIGHTLGAAGAIETAICAELFSRKSIPPTCGLLEPDEKAEGMVSAEAQDFDGDYILKCNSGFGGVNAALVLGRG